jgi:hypothetical protein
VPAKALLIAALIGHRTSLLMLACWHGDCLILSHCKFADRGSEPKQVHCGDVSHLGSCTRGTIGSLFVRVLTALLLGVMLGIASPRFAVELKILSDPSRDRLRTARHNMRPKLRPRSFSDTHFKQSCRRAPVCRGRRIACTLYALVAYRIGSYIRIPGIDPTAFECAMALDDRSVLS